VELALNPARLHLFDARSGESILQRPVASSTEALRSAREAWIDESVQGRPDQQREAEAHISPVKKEDFKRR
jgi:CO dehydrogenase/acetyl-CoA synthase delta subunit